MNYTWNGCAIIPDPYWSRSPDLALFMYASGTLGYGVYYDGHWIANSWPAILKGCSIQWKELYPIALSCLLWGHLWLGKKILFHCDNQPVVDIWASGTSREPLIMHLVCSIFFSGATHHFTVPVSHIVGTDNLIADSLPCLQMAWSGQLAPEQQTQHQHPLLPQHRPSGMSLSLPSITCSYGWLHSSFIFG